MNSHIGQGQHENAAKTISAEFLLERMTAIRGLSNRRKSRESAKSVLSASLNCPIDLFDDLLRVYDEFGSPYWSEWLAEPLKVLELIDLLRLHLAGEMPISDITLSEREEDLARTLPYSLGALIRVQHSLEVAEDIKLAAVESGKFGAFPLTGLVEPHTFVVDGLKLRLDLVPKSLRRYLDGVTLARMSGALIDRSVGLIWAKAPEKARGGRPPKYNWPPIEAKLADKLRDDGFPARGEQVGLESWVAEQFEPGPQPSESVIRERVVNAIDKHRREVG